MRGGKTLVNALAIGMLAFAGLAHAQDWPARPVTMRPTDSAAARLQSIMATGLLQTIAFRFPWNAPILARFCSSTTGSSLAGNCIFAPQLKRHWMLRSLWSRRMRSWRRISNSRLMPL